MGFPFESIPFAICSEITIRGRSLVKKKRKSVDAMRLEIEPIIIEIQ
jgi:hypothetical protein